MPRQRKAGGPEPKKRSRTGCWPCKARKVKCGEEKPRCLNCERQGETCDYSIRLNWGGRTKNRDDSGSGESILSFASPQQSTFSLGESSGGTPEPTDTPNHRFKQAPTSNFSDAHSPSTDTSNIDPDLIKISQAPSTSMGFASHDSNLGTFQFHVGPSRSTNGHLSAPPRSTGFSHLDLRHQSSQFRSSSDYPSPSASSLEGTSYSTGSNGYQVKSSTGLEMPPPLRGTYQGERPGRDLTLSPDHRSKRVKLSPSGSPPMTSPGLYSIAHEVSHERANHPNLSADMHSPNAGSLTPYSPMAGTPLTPTSSIASDEAYMKQGPTSAPIIYQKSDPRRMSVDSMLSSPTGDAPQGINQLGSGGRQYPVADSHDGTTTYGYDLGQPDFDTPNNSDGGAIRVFSPPVTYGMPFFTPKTQEEAGGAEFGFGLQSKDIAFERGGYYAKPVPIKIPSSLEPLPSRLLENPMNLLYFHHFMNHTARILVPHDCEENPFRNILPAMAVRDDNLLNLMLAFSASHRARLLNHPEPVNRMAVWVQDVFPRLRGALEDDSTQVSNENLTAAIMLASLEIISPNAFEVPISWQNHLMLARQMMIARGGPEAVKRRDKVSYFLSRWFAYLDVLGSLSGRGNARPMSSTYWSTDDFDYEDDFQIDCLLGFTGRCVGILARIAELAKQCEPERIDENGDLRQDWEPSEDVEEQAEKLKIALRESRERGSKGCAHRPSESENDSGWDSLEIYATNDAYHWAALIHLLRRILGKPSMDAEVQNAVAKIVDVLSKVRPGGTAEACLLFPMFTAGCDALDSGQRDRIMERLRGVEEFGMTQVRKARTLMQKVWETGKPWETLVCGEFVG